MAWLMINSTIVRGHVSALDALGGAKKQSIGRSRGDWAQKFTYLAMKNGGSRFILSPAEQSVDRQALFLRGQKAKKVLRDKGDDASYILEAIQKMGSEPVTPPRSMRKQKRNVDCKTYKVRNIIERLFGQLKLVATHCSPP